MIYYKVYSMTERNAGEFKKTNYIILDENAQFCRSKLKIVDFICDSNNRSSETIRIIKILEWSFCCDVSKLRTFIDVCVYYRIWIINFIIIVFYIHRLFKNEKSFVWTEEQKNNINILKLILTITSILKFLNCFFLTDEIILTVNFSLKKWNAIFF